MKDYKLPQVRKSDLKENIRGQTVDTEKRLAEIREKTRGLRWVKP